MSGSLNGARYGVAIALGAALSFLGLGVLWIGTPWPAQALMLIPFFGATAALRRTDPNRRDWTVPVILGAAPLGALITRFRDPSGSHLFPVLIVCAWAAGAWAGSFCFRTPPEA